jgi:hypothetical protein
VNRFFDVLQELPELLDGKAVRLTQTVAGAPEQPVESSSRVYERVPDSGFCALVRRDNDEERQ